MRAKRLLNQRGVDVFEVDVSEDRTEMAARSGGRETVPQIFIGDMHVGGFEELVALDRTGALAQMLAG